MKPRPHCNDLAWALELIIGGNVIDSRGDETGFATKSSTQGETMSKWLGAMVVALALVFVMGPAVMAADARKMTKRSSSEAAWYAKRQKIRADWIKHRMAMVPLKRQLWILKLELKMLLLRDKVNVAAVKAKIQQIAAQKAKIMLQKVMFKLAMRKKYPKLALFRGYRGWRRGWRGHRGWRGWGGGDCTGRGYMWRGMMPWGGGYHMMGPGMMGPGYMMPGYRRSWRGGYHMGPGYMRPGYRRSWRGGYRMGPGSGDERGQGMGPGYMMGPGYRGHMGPME